MLFLSWPKTVRIYEMPIYYLFSANISTSVFDCVINRYRGSGFTPSRAAVDVTVVQQRCIALASRHVRAFGLAGRFTSEPTSFLLVSLVQLRSQLNRLAIEMLYKRSKYLHFSFNACIRPWLPHFLKPLFANMVFCFKYCYRYFLTGRLYFCWLCSFIYVLREV